MTGVILIKISTNFCITSFLNSVLKLNIAQQAFKFGLHKGIGLISLTNNHFKKVRFYTAPDIAQNKLLGITFIYISCLN